LWNSVPWWEDRPVPDLVDRLAGLALRIPTASSTIFPEGWGDPAAFDLIDLSADQIAAASIEWSPKTEHPGIRVRRGRFASPLAGLTDDSPVPVELVEPGTGTDRLVLLLPAWNDEGFRRRRELARALAGQGVAAAVAEIPLYGRRRRHRSPGMPIRTVADFIWMGAGAVAEGHALLAAMADRFPRLGVAGFSMGGNLAALVSAGSERPLATAVMAGPPSPEAAYLDGNLRHGIDWRALGGREAEPALRERLGAISALSTPPLPHHRCAVVVGGRNDGFVPPEAVAALAGHWGVDVRWLSGGHGVLWWRHRHELVGAVLDSFEYLISADRGSAPG
jgi:dienelactone hydrolase